MKPLASTGVARRIIGPQDLALKEQFPAYVALDTEYMAEVRRRESAAGQTAREFNQQFVDDAENPLFTLPKAPDPKEVQANVQSCLERKNHGKSPQ